MGSGVGSLLMNRLLVCILSIISYLHYAFMKLKAASLCQISFSVVVEDLAFILELVLYNFLLCTRCKQKKAILLEEVSEKVFQTILDSSNAWQAALVVYLWQAEGPFIYYVITCRGGEGVRKCQFLIIFSTKKWGEGGPKILKL